MKPIYISLAGLPLVVAGCMTVQRVQPADFIPTHSPEVVWVTTNDNARTPVVQPQIVGDVLQGTRRDFPQQPVAIALKDINYVQAKLPSPGRTALLAIVIGAAVIGLGYMVATSDRVTSYTCGVLKGGTGDYCGP